MKKFCVIILNYRTSEDCIRLLRELAKSRHSKLSAVVVVDNDSGDFSLEKIYRALAPSHATGSDYQHLINVDGLAIHLLQAGVNGGFAAGNNLGVRFARQVFCPDAYLICNPDISFPENQLSTFVSEFEENRGRNPAIHLFGNVLSYFDDPALIQAVGGKISLPFCRTWHVGCDTRDSAAVRASLAPIVDYPVGACIFITEYAFEMVGDLDEGYFLYYEELDYVRRLVGRGFCFAVGVNATILHVEGASVGSDSKKASDVSLVSDFFINKNKLRFAWKHQRKCLPFVVLLIAANIVRRICRGDIKKSINLLLCPFLRFPLLH